MIIVEIVFWLCLGLIVYTYAGYGALLAILNKIIRRPDPLKREGQPEEPAVTLVVAAYNEAACLRQKIRNCFELEYPVDKLHLLFIIDGSTDDSPNIIREYPGIRLLHHPERLGKTAALNRAMKQVVTPVTVFCDANTLLNTDAITKIVRHYADPRIGGVAGEKKIMVSGDDGISGQGEGIYWRYESWLKKLDSDFYSVVGAAGELFSVRTRLYEPVEEDAILDDFIISMRIALHGYRVVYESEAYATELPSDSLQEEQKRKIRISAGAFQAMKMIGSQLNPLKLPRLTFLYLSHRVLRWTVCPLCLILIFVINIYLSISALTPIYDVLLIFQIAFYGTSIMGAYYFEKGKQYKLFHVPRYFVFMNTSVIRGFFRYAGGKQSARWEKVRRKQAS